MSAHKATVALKPSARRDVRSILLYTGQQWGSVQRDIYWEGIERAITTLGENPHIGRPREEIAPELRSLRVHQHVIYYRLDADVATILRILHGRVEAALHFGAT